MYVCVYIYIYTYVYIYIHIIHTHMRVLCNVAAFGLGESQVRLSYQNMPAYPIPRIQYIPDMP